MVKHDGFNNAGEVKDTCISTIVHVPMDNLAVTFLSDFLTKSIEKRLKENKDIE